MIIAAADIGASNCGLCLWNGTFRPSSWHPSEDGPGSDINYSLEARRLMEWRSFFWSWLVGEGVEALAVELPLRSDMSRGNAEEGWAPATSMKTVWRCYSNTSAAIEIATRLNIRVEMVSAGKWRNSFLGVSRAPKTIKATQRRAWWKAQVRTELARLGIKTRNNDQGDAGGLCYYFRGLLRLEGIGARPGELLERATA